MTTRTPVQNESEAVTIMQTNTTRPDQHSPSILCAPLFCVSIGIIGLTAASSINGCSAEQGIREENFPDYTYTSAGDLAKKARFVAET